MKQSYTLEDMYETYQGRLNKKVFKEIIKLYGELVIDNLLKGYKIILPKGMGYIKLTKGKFKTPAIDWQMTKKIYGEYNKLHPEDKKVVYHDNTHSDGYRVKIIWARNNSPIRHKGFFTFRFTRYNSRKISRLIQENNELIYNIVDI